MIRKLSAFLNSPISRGAVGILVVGFGLKLLSDLSADLGTRVDEIEAHIAEREAYLRTLPAPPEPVQQPYPRPVDLNPLGHPVDVDQAGAAGVVEFALS